MQVLANNMAAALRLFMGFFCKVVPLYDITLCLYTYAVASEDFVLHQCLVLSCTRHGEVILLHRLVYFGIQHLKNHVEISLSSLAVVYKLVLQILFVQSGC